MRKYSVNSFVFESGERFCHVIDKISGEPLYYPKPLYNHTSQEQIKVDQHDGGYWWKSGITISIFFSLRGIDIRERIATLQFLDLNEIDDLADFASKTSKTKEQHFA